jgi:hypothetical protein
MLLYCLKINEIASLQIKTVINFCFLIETFRCCKIIMNAENDRKFNFQKHFLTSINYHKGFILTQNLIAFFLQWKCEKGNPSKKITFMQFLNRFGYTL